MLAGLRGHVVEVDAVVVLPHAVADDLEVLAGEVEPHAVREVPAVGEVQAQDRVAGLERGEEDGHVRLRPECGCTLACVGAEELLHAVDGERLGDVDELAAAVVALAGVALGVLVRQARPLRGHDGRAGVVLAGDHLEAELLPLPLALNRGKHLGIGLLKKVHRIDSRNLTTKTRSPHKGHREEFIT